MDASGFPTREVARVLGMTSAQVRSFVKDGFVAPGRGARGEFLFSFQDIVLLRAARGLSAELSARKVRRALRKLKTQLGAGEPIARVSIRVQDGELVARDKEGGAAWDPDSGQAMLDFEVADIRAKVAPLTVIHGGADARIKSADEWYEAGLDLETSGSHTEAERAYRAALAIDPKHADASINLGRILHAGGDARAATSLYKTALATRPNDATAEFNLGVALEDLGDEAGALAAYTRALATDDDLADAHYNASRLYERRGNGPAALRHLTRYRELVR